MQKNVILQSKMLAAPLCYHSLLLAIVQLLFSDYGTVLLMVPHPSKVHSEGKVPFRFILYKESFLVYQDIDLTNLVGNLRLTHASEFLSFATG
jgi:hypothetical protein